jgi:FlaA1/EpsC-like NDP-sugar epimerase
MLNMSISEIALRRRILLVLHRLRKVASEKNSPRWIIFFTDAFISVIGVLLGYIIRFGFHTEQIDFDNLLKATFLVLIVRIVYAVVFKIYAHVIRYTSLHDIKRVFTTVSFGTATILIFVYFSRLSSRGVSMPLSVIVMEFFFTMFLMVNVRLFIRYIYILLTNIDLDSKSVVVIGSKELAILLKETIELHPKENYKTIAFADSRGSYKKRLAGLMVYRLDELQYLVEKFDVSHFVIAKRDISRDEKELVGKIAQKYSITMLTAPDLWHSEQTGKLSIEEINMEELLEREPIKLEKDHISNDICDKNVLITGAAGSIGSELVRQIALYKPKNLILIDQAESPLYDIELELSENYEFENYAVVLADILNKSRIEKAFRTFKPDIVYHAAAYKHVPMMESNPIEAFENNVMGSRILADLSHQFGVEKFVMVSTDKAVNPTGIMGATKRMAEIYIQALNSNSKTNFITTRFGNVLNSNGSVIPRFLKQIKEGGPVTVTHPDITRYFMTIPEACQLVLEASVMGNGGEVYLFDMGNAVKILDLAKNLIRSTGYVLGRDIEIKFTGLRPGEKLYEELLLEAENNMPTHHPKIKIAEVCPQDYEEIKNYLDKFIFPVESQNINELVKLMKEMVPTYKSKNSVFEKLDKAV